MMPKVSIIVPCYNQAHFLSEVLQSVLEQTYTDWECIIVNDGSPDNVEEKTRAWLVKDSRFKYLEKENGGLSSARNFGIMNSEGKYILPLDADDKIAPDYILRGIDLLQKDSDLKVVYCKAELFGDASGAWVLDEYSPCGLSKSNMIFCSALYRKSDWERVGGYDVNMIYGLEDWEFWIAILKDGGTVRCLDYIGFYYRIKSNSMVKDLNNLKRKYLFEYMSVKHADFFVKHLGSFIELYTAVKKTELGFLHILKSKKFVIGVFCHTFFGFSFFGKYKAWKEDKK